MKSIRFTITSLLLMKNNKIQFGLAHFIHQLLLAGLFFFCINKSTAQNSMTGDGFGGRLWYVAHNYQMGAYSAFTVCGDNNQLYGWGSNLFGELGNGTLISTTTPVAAIGITDVKFYATGYISAAIKNDGTAWAWGVGNFPSQYPTGMGPVPVLRLTDVKFVDAGENHIVYVRNDSTVWATGLNTHGQLGNGNTSFNATTTPVEMLGVHNAVRAIAVGGATQGATLILLADGTVKKTGGEDWFSAGNSTIPEIYPGLNNIVDLKGNAIAAYALDSSGNVYSFGRDLIFPGNPIPYYPVLGLGVPTGNTVLPTKITFPAGAASIVALSSNDDGACAMALDANHNVYAWGSNQWGQIGIGNALNATTPVLVATDVIDIWTGENASYILKSDHTLWATGKSGYDWSDWGSIWMNLPNMQRNVFTQIDPTVPPMNLCPVKTFGNLCTIKTQLGNDKTLCEGEKIILNASLSNATYLWQDQSSAATFTVTTPGTYWVNVTQAYCSSADTIAIFYKPLPTVDLGKDTSLCQGEKLFLDVSNFNATYLWQDHSINSNYTITKPGEYWVHVVADGCEKGDTISVISKKCNCTLKVPTAITPNGDGINDKWVFTDQDCFQQVDVFVYNRFGTLLYQKKNYQNDWEGTYKSKMLPDATYYYIIKTVSPDKTEQVLRGNVSILR